MTTLDRRTLLKRMAMASAAAAAASLVPGVSFGEDLARWLGDADVATPGGVARFEDNHALGLGLKLGYQF